MPRDVIWLLVDDLRVALNEAYGQSEAVTPALDALARESVVFERAYCQLPVCSPSRNSFLTGRRPDSLRVYNFETHFRATSADAVSIFEYFKARGYTTVGSGKTFQPNKPPSYDGLRSWSSRGSRAWYLPLTKNLTWCRHRRGQKRLDVCPEDLPETQFMDRLVADFVVEALRTAPQPYFVVAGFYRPHLRWVAPRQFYDLFPVAPQPPRLSRTKPRGMPDIAWTNEGCHTLTTQEERGVIDMDKPLRPELAAELARGYYACVAWIDYLCGGVLAAAPKDAVVVVSSDHGFHLGEQASWTKHTLFELGARVPLLVRDSNLQPRTVAAPVELVDIFRTLVDLAGLPAPDAEVVQGRSLVPLMRAGEPRRTDNGTGLFAVSQYPRCPASFDRLWDTNCKRVPTEDIPIMGYSLRVDGFRFTDWYRLPVAKRQPIATELYAYDEARLHDTDTALELRNIAPSHPCAVALFRQALLLFVLSCQFLRSSGASSVDRRSSCLADVRGLVARARRAVQSRSVQCAAGGYQSPPLLAT